MSRALALALMLTGAACKKAAKPSGPVAYQTLEGFSLSQSDGGAKLWSLTARTGLLKEEEKQALLTQPRMEFFKKGRKVTNLTADSGTVRTDNSDVRLSSSVVVASLEDDSVLRTEALVYDSSRRKFLTDSDVTITRPGGTLRGRGLEANPDLSEIRIFRQTSVMQKTP